MRIRFKPWARPELEACKFYIDNPEDYKGKWKTAFKNTNNPIHLELGCGKGNFVSQIALQNPNVNYIAIDLVDAMLGLAKRHVFDIERILLMMNNNDNIERIYINFCNPWPRGKHRKKRLTHTRQLEKYKEFLIPGGEIHFKTDDDDLFESSINYFKEADFEIIKLTYDLHSEIDWEDIQTEHEKMFSEKGIKIKALIARLTKK